MLILFFAWLVSSLSPVPEGDAPNSTVLESVEGELLGARIAADGQWRFPRMDSVPMRFEQSLLAFEDRRFYSHFAIDPRAISRAIRANWRAGKVVQGGSTLTMQLARLLSNHRERSYGNKAIETLLAFHLEHRLSKKEILARYASMAPFGGNVVGLETAAWRYYGRSPWELSWAESATLAVLPNAPALIYPGRAQEALLAKRDRLLTYLYGQGTITQQEYRSALLEDLPSRPTDMPDHAMHLMDRYLANAGSDSRFPSTVQADLQRKTQAMMDAHLKQLSRLEVSNGAIIILDTRSQDILAYVGNGRDASAQGHAVDCARAARNSGSILKPLLYARMLQEGELSPRQLMMDIPTRIADYRPQNYLQEYDGAVPADEALARSLNIPFVRALQDYGVGRFQQDLQSLGLTTLHRSPQEYGLALMLGGAEVRLDELANIYARMGAALDEQASEEWSAWTLHHTFEAMTQLSRPEGRQQLSTFRAGRKIAWKTGTSFGHKDAWAIGVTPDHTIAVWIGNADGEGRDGLTGLSAAAPLLFKVLDQLPTGHWFATPQEGGHLTELCATTGYRIGEHCPQVENVNMPTKDLEGIGTCPFHLQRWTSPDARHFADPSCASTDNWAMQTHFILPPIMSHYYAQRHADYPRPPQPWPGCQVADRSMQFVYPTGRERIYIPLDLDGQRGRFSAEVQHLHPDTDLFWYLDERYLGRSHRHHEMPVLAGLGSHTLLVVDSQGEEIAVSFEVLSEEE